MPDKDKINLLSERDFKDSTVGKLVDWIVSVGRWIVVLTEFVVICAFLSRFYFDTQLANLFDSIRQKKAMVNSTQDFENEFLKTQGKIKIIKNLLAEEKKSSEVINQISLLLPLDVTLTEIQIDTNDLRISGYSLSEQGINVFLKQMKNNNQFSQINLGTIKQKEDTSEITFEINALINYD